MKAFLAVLVIVLCVGFSTSLWTQSCTEAGACPNVMIDIGAINATHACVVGGYSSQHDVDHAMGVYCSGKDNEWTRLPHNQVLGMQVSIATSAKGNIATAGIGFANITSHLLHNVVVPVGMNSSNWWGGCGQDIKVIRTPELRPREQTMFAFVGALDMLENTEGLLRSADGGRTYAPVQSDLPVNFLRYGAYPRPDTYFVTAGTWPETASTDAEYKDIQDRCIRLSQNICSPAPAHYDSAAIQRVNSRVYNPLNRRRQMAKLAQYQAENGINQSGCNGNNLNMKNPSNGYYGAVVLTRDGGLTWKTVFQTGEFYFNDIACFDITNCISVAEADKTAFVMVTNDGGATWNKTFEISSNYMASLMRIRLAGDVAFISGGNVDDEIKMHGLIYKSLDKGKTWVEDASVDDVGILVGLDFTEDGKHGYAIGSTRDQRTIVVKYTKD